MNTLARSIIDDALACARRYPARSALEVLDMAMAGRQGSAPDFSTGDGSQQTALHPRTAFGELLCEAFALGLPPHTLNAQWRDEVVAAFAKRYRLWETESAPA
jgi:hypothetical protein